MLELKKDLIKFLLLFFEASGVDILPQLQTASNVCLSYFVDSKEQA